MRQLAHWSFCELCAVMRTGFWVVAAGFVLLIGHFIYRYGCYAQWLWPGTGMNDSCGAGPSDGPALECAEGSTCELFWIGNRVS